MSDHDAQHKECPHAGKYQYSDLHLDPERGLIKNPSGIIRLEKDYPYPKCMCEEPRNYSHIWSDLYWAVEKDEK